MGGQAQEDPAGQAGCPRGQDKGVWAAPAVARLPESPVPVGMGQEPEQRLTSSNFQKWLSLGCSVTLVWDRDQEEGQVTSRRLRGVSEWGHQRPSVPRAAWWDSCWVNAMACLQDSSRRKGLASPSNNPLDSRGLSPAVIRTQNGKHGRTGSLGVTRREPKAGSPNSPPRIPQRASGGARTRPAPTSWLSAWPGGLLLSWSAREECQALTLRHWMFTESQRHTETGAKGDGTPSQTAEAGALPA